MPDICHLVFIRSTPEKIYEAITTQQGIASWWSIHNDATPKVGSTYRISLGGDYHKDIRITELVPNKKVAWQILEAHPEWLTTTVSFDISMGKSIAELRFNHAGWKEYSDMFGQCNHHWGIYLQNLKIFTETGKPLAMAEFF